MLDGNGPGFTLVGPPEIRITALDTRAQANMSTGGVTIDADLNVCATYMGTHIAGGNVLYRDGHVDSSRYPANTFRNLVDCACTLGRYGNASDGF